MFLLDDYVSLSVRDVSEGPSEVGELFTSSMNFDLQPAAENSFNDDQLYFKYLIMN